MIVSTSSNCSAVADVQPNGTLVNSIANARIALSMLRFFTISPPICSLHFPARKRRFLSATYVSILMEERHICFLLR